MPFATLQGIRIPLLSAPGADQIRTSTGVTFSSGLGQMDSGRRQKRRVWRGTACFYAEGDSYADGAAFRELLAGRGHLVRFSEGFEASTWLGPEPGYRDCYVDPTAADPFGGSTGILQVRASGVTDRPFLAYDFQLPPTGWALVWWEYDDDGFYHRALSWDGATRRGWQNGVRDDDVGTASGPGANNFLRPIVTDGIARLVRAGSAAFQIGPVLGLQFCPSNTQMAQLTQHIQPFGPMPALRLEGDMIGEEWVHVRPTPLRSDFFLLYDSSGRRNNVRLIEFDLAEVVVQDVRGSRVFGIASTQPDQGPYQQEDEPETSEYGSLLFSAFSSSGIATSYDGTTIIPSLVTALNRMSWVCVDEESGAFKWAVTGQVLPDNTTSSSNPLPASAWVNGRLWLIIQWNRPVTASLQGSVLFTGPLGTLSGNVGVPGTTGIQSVACEVDPETGALIGLTRMLDKSTTGSAAGDICLSDMPPGGWLEASDNVVFGAGTSRFPAGNTLNWADTSHTTNNLGQVATVNGAFLDGDFNLIDVVNPKTQRLFCSGVDSPAAGRTANQGIYPMLATEAGGLLVDGNAFLVAYFRSGASVGNVSYNQDTGGAATSFGPPSGTNILAAVVRTAPSSDALWAAAVTVTPVVGAAAAGNFGGGYLPLSDGGIVLLAGNTGVGAAGAGDFVRRTGLGATLTTAKAANESPTLLWCLDDDGDERWLKRYTFTGNPPLTTYCQHLEHEGALFGVELHRANGTAVSGTITVAPGEANAKTITTIGANAANAFNNAVRLLTKRDLATGNMLSLPPAIQATGSTVFRVGSPVIRGGELCLYSICDASISIDAPAPATVLVGASTFKRLRFDIDTLEFLGADDLPTAASLFAYIGGGPLVFYPPDQGPYQQEDEPTPSVFGDAIYSSYVASGVAWSYPQSQIEVVGPNNSIIADAGLTLWQGGQAVAFEVDPADGTLLGSIALSNGTIATGFGGESTDSGSPPFHWLECDGERAVWGAVQYNCQGQSWNNGAYTENVVNGGGWRAVNGIVDSDALLVSGSAPRVQSIFQNDSNVGSRSVGVFGFMNILPQIFATPAPRMIGGSRYLAYACRGRSTGPGILSYNQNTGGAATTRSVISSQAAAFWIVKVGPDNDAEWVACYGGIDTTTQMLNFGGGYAPLLDGGIVVSAYGYGLGFGGSSTQTFVFSPGSGSDVTVATTNINRTALWCLNSDGTHRWVKQAVASGTVPFGLWATGAEQVEHAGSLIGLEGYMNIGTTTNATVTIGVGEANEKSGDAIGANNASAYGRQRWFLTKRSLVDGTLEVLPPIIHSPTATTATTGSTVIRDGEICITVRSDGDILIDIGAIMIPAGHYRLRFDVNTLAYLGSVPLPATNISSSWTGPLLTLPSRS